MDGSSEYTGSGNQISFPYLFLSDLKLTHRIFLSMVQTYRVLSSQTEDNRGNSKFFAYFLMFVTIYLQQIFEVLHLQPILLRRCTFIIERFASVTKVQVHEKYHQIKFGQWENNSKTKCIIQRVSNCSYQSNISLELIPESGLCKLSLETF